MNLMRALVVVSLAGCGSGGLRLLTDKSSYRTGDSVRLTLDNGTSSTVLISTCGARLDGVDGGHFVVGRGSDAECIARDSSVGAFSTLDFDLVLPGSGLAGDFVFISDLDGTPSSVTSLPVRISE